jgi:hypothetical protein
MLTLDRWREFTITPKTLTFPHLELIGPDHSPSIAVGSGEVRMDTLNEFRFELRGMPADIPYALAEMRRHHEDPYAPFSRPRLIGTDGTGVKWNGGYTIPTVTAQNPIWTFTGVLESLSTEDQTASVARDSGTELIFPLRVGDRMALHLARYVREVEPTNETSVRRHHELTLLGSKIRFSFEPLGTLSVTATWSSDFSAPYCENWLSEPLRILFGQLIFPRLVVRNFGGGRAAVSVRRSPPVITNAHWVALWQLADEHNQDDAFWSIYSSLLEFVALARGKQGEPNLEANKITRLYEECIQAAGSTRWVWALTFASANEALVRILGSLQGAGESEEASAAVLSAWTKGSDELSRHIEGWAGDDGLKRRAIGALIPRPKGTAKTLRELRAVGVIQARHLSAWNDLRHAVMHGGLISAYSTKEEDEKLLLLADMLRALTRELLRRRSNVPVAVPMNREQTRRPSTFRR